MADVQSSIFNKKATEKLRSPDDLDKYVRVTNPSVWAVLAACIALLVGLLAWGVFGSVATSVTATGTVVDDKAICFLTAENTAKVHVGDAAYVGEEQMTVASISKTPYSRSESNAVLSDDYLVSTLMPSDWAYMVTFEGDISELTVGVPLTVSITTQQVAPISLVLGGNK